MSHLIKNILSLLLLLCILILTTNTTAQSSAPPGRIELLEQATSPYPIQNGWVTLPDGSGTLHIHLKTKNVTKTEFYLVPTGTQTWSLRKWLGTGKQTTDGWTFDFHYGTGQYHDHIVILLISPTETLQTSFNITRAST